MWTPDVMMPRSIDLALGLGTEQKQPWSIGMWSRLEWKSSLIVGTTIDFIGREERCLAISPLLRHRHKLSGVDLWVIWRIRKQWYRFRQVRYRLSMFPLSLFRLVLDRTYSDPILRQRQSVVLLKQWIERLPAACRRWPDTDADTHTPPHPTPPQLHLSLSLLLCVCRASIYEWCIFEINYLIPTSVPRILSLAMPCHVMFHRQTCISYCSWEGQVVMTQHVWSVLLACHVMSCPLQYTTRRRWILFPHSLHKRNIRSPQLWSSESSSPSPSSKKGKMVVRIIIIIISIIITEER